jgi:hypothetical protein
MKFTKQSKQLMQLFRKNIAPIKQNSKTDGYILNLYDDLLDAYHSPKPNYKGVVKSITNSGHITRPKTFKSSDLPVEVVKHIDEHSSSEITYSFAYLERKYQVHFITQELANNVDLSIYDRYINAILMWLFILNIYSSKQCSNTLILYIYMTSLDKRLPESKTMVLNEGNVNTAFTWGCPVNSEIVIFRKEEWFKVFIHETFHSYGLDFSSMDISASTKYMLNIFKVNSKVNLFEAYTEVWAEMINIMFCSFFSLRNKTNETEFLNTFEDLINYERGYSFFQMVKVLHYMGLDYKDLYSSSDKGRMLREMLYKEDTNVLAYYIIKSVLLNNYQSFLQWCNRNNDSIMQFKKTEENQMEFCRFIERNYKSSSMLDGVRHASEIFYNEDGSNKFVRTNMRMTIAELG